MSFKDVHLFGRKFTVEVCVELCLPRLADHCFAPSAAPAVGVPLASSWHATSVTSRCLLEWKVFPQSPGTTSPPLRKEGESRGNAPAVGPSRCEPVASSSARLGSFPASHAQALVQVRPPPNQGGQSLSLSIRGVRSRTCYARCETSMPGNWSPAGTTRTLSKPWRRFPELGLRLRRDSVSTSARSCKADRRAALPVLRTNRIEGPFLTRTQDENYRVAPLFPHINNNSGGIKPTLSGYELRGEPAVLWRATGSLWPCLWSGAEPDQTWK